MATKIAAESANRAADRSILPHEYAKGGRMKGLGASMSALRTVKAELRRLPSDVAGQAVVTYAIAACLFAAALVLATSAWNRDAVLPDRPAAEDHR
jgi:hypothetical protein